MRRDRPMLIASAVVGILLCVSLVALAGLLITDRKAMQDSHQVLDRVQRQQAKVSAAQAKIDAQMHQPENAQVLFRSEMYNELIRRKAVSWTRIFSDLGTVLPYNVRLVSIRPQLNAHNELALDMVVASDTPEPVFGFIAKLEGSDIFGALTESTQIPPTQNDPYYRFHLVVIYDQKL
jgi:Tfp pilus assembly protein PilN